MDSNITKDNTAITLLTGKNRLSLDEIEYKIKDLPQLDAPVKNYFSDGVYIRECFMMAGSFVIGHRHKTKHLNNVIQGRAKLYINGVVREIKAPFTFESNKGDKKAFSIIEDLIFQTIHENKDNERDVNKLEDRLVEKLDYEKIALQHKKKLKDK